MKLFFIYYKYLWPNFTPISSNTTLKGCATGVKVDRYGNRDSAQNRGGTRRLIDVPPDTGVSDVATPKPFCVFWTYRQPASSRQLVSTGLSPPRLTGRDFRGESKLRARGSSPVVNPRGERCRYVRPADHYASGRGEWRFLYAWVRPPRRRDTVARDRNESGPRLRFRSR